MEELLACRVCLATDIKLYNMYKYNLVAAYELFSCSTISTTDGLPQQICTFCATLLWKCMKFHQLCRSSQQILHHAVMENKVITLEYIQSLNRLGPHLTLTYNVELAQQNVITIKEEDDDITNIINSIIEGKDDIKQEKENNSDEEPLAKIVKKNKKRKKVKKRKEIEDLEVAEHKYDDISIKEEEVMIDFPLDVNDDFDDYIDDKMPFEFDGTDVIVLSKHQQIEDLQARKESENYKNSRLRCEMCYKGFMTEATYENHLIKHDPSYGPYSCDVCKLRWPNARTLKSHMASTHEKKYICRRCTYVCRSTNKAKEHIRWHEGFVYTCDICGATFNKSTSHLTHIRLQHPSDHTCGICHESFISPIGLKQHAKKAHRSEQVQPPNKSIKLETHCSGCRTNFRSEAALRTHHSFSQNTECDPSLKPCVECGESFITRLELKAHMRKTHHNHKCDKCNKTFSTAKYLGVHHHRVHRGFRSPRVANGAVVCETCGKTCKSQSTFMYHRRIHSGEKPYQCSECPKKFSVYQRLQIHIRTHTGERPFKCTQCPKAFKHKAALNRHDRVHTGAKPYACPHCGKSFSQSNSMKTHVRSVHLKLPALYRRAHRQKCTETGIYDD